MTWGGEVVVVPGPVVIPVQAGGTPVPVPVSNVTVHTDDGAAVAADLAAHVTAERPHPAAESGRDFAGWFNAQTV